MKKLNVVWFYFFIPMVFGLIRPWFCYVTFLKIPYSLRKFLQFLWFFLGIFFGKKPSWYPHGCIYDFHFAVFMCSNFWFIPIMIFSLLQIFLTCFSSPYCYLSKDFFSILRPTFWSLWSKILCLAFLTFIVTSY